MAPVKFGLFKARSRDYQEQPSTENLLHTSASSDHVATPSSPVASTSKSVPVEDQASADLASLNLNLDYEEAETKKLSTRRQSESSALEENHINYKPLKNQQSTDASSISTQQSDEDQKTAIDQDDASTCCDAMSLQFDETSITASEDLSTDFSVHCGTLRKNKKLRSREVRQLRDFDMWQASNVEVMQNLLIRSGSQDEQIKWEAIATSRGLCILKDSCTCGDCTRAKYLAGMADGDGGLGAAPLFSAISVGCQIQ